MPAPTALQHTLPAVDKTQDGLESQDLAASSEIHGRTLLDPTAPSDQPVAADSAMEIDVEGRPIFAPAANVPQTFRVESRKVQVPPHRLTPLKKAWSSIYPPLVNHLKLQVRMNIKSRTVELKTSTHTTDPGALQKGEDFVRAFAIHCFDIDDAIAMLKLDDLYIQTFEITDVKSLSGDHLSRAIGRIAGKDGKTKSAIENATKTRIVLADSTVHILGGFKNIHCARETVVSLILGAPPAKVYGNLRTISARMKERF